MKLDVYWWVVVLDPVSTLVRGWVSPPTPGRPVAPTAFHFYELLTTKPLSLLSHSLCLLFTHTDTGADTHTHTSIDTHLTTHFYCDVLSVYALASWPVYRGCDWQSWYSAKSFRSSLQQVLVQTSTSNTTCFVSFTTFSKYFQTLLIYTVFLYTLCNTPNVFFFYIFILCH